MNENIIEVKNLKKYFKEVKAVDDISFKVKKGELFAFLGLNGAGKSTTINVITGTLLKDSGEVYVNGLDVSKDSLDIKKNIGVVFQNSVLDRNLTVYENLKYRGNLYGLKGKELSERIDKLADMLDFKTFLSRTFSKLSGGQKRKVDIARALINNPQILILDEPTTGLDPKTRGLMWEVLTNFRKKEGLTVFLTTHYMEEASNADYVVIIDEGKIVAADTPNLLKEMYTGDFIKVHRANGSDYSELLDFVTSKDISYTEEREFYLIKVSDSKEAKSLIVERPDLFDDFEVYKGTMDDVFLNVTGKKIVEA